MKKLIVFIMAAVLVSCSQPETKKVKQKEYVKKESKEMVTRNTFKRGCEGDICYERSLDTINVSGYNIVVAVYRLHHGGLSTVVISKKVN